MSWKLNTSTSSWNIILKSQLLWMFHYEWVCMDKPLWFLYVWTNRCDFRAPFSCAYFIRLFHAQMSSTIMYESVWMSVWTWMKLLKQSCCMYGYERYEPIDGVWISMNRNMYGIARVWIEMKAIMHFNSVWIGDSRVCMEHPFTNGYESIHTP